MDKKYFIIYNEKTVLNVIDYDASTHLALPECCKYLTETITNAKVMLLSMGVDTTLLNAFTSAKPYWMDNN